MRQAGRVLPEYRALREHHGFLELVRTPDLATEVTLQPIRRFAFDAAIIFSDILVIPEALGQPYHFTDEGGIRMAFTLRSAADIARLDTAAVPQRLAYVGDALRLVHRELAGRTALIGFSGSPWTLANFMIEGGSGAGFERALQLWQSDPATYDALAERLTEAIIAYLHLQCDAGAEVIQVFDTLAHLLPAPLFTPVSGRWLARIVAALQPRVPVIVFAKGARVPLPELLATGAAIQGFDASRSPSELRSGIPPSTAVQGNLDPPLLLAHPDALRLATRSVLEAWRGRPGHIFNLGHGVPPATPIDNLHVLVNTIRSFS
jgi:uroporphyrinogen decarboxylase